MRTKLKRISIGTLIFLLLSVVVFTLYYPKHPKIIMPTYFSYQTAQTSALKNLESTQTINQTELKHWDETTFDLIRNNKIGDKDVAHIFSYLYTAQRDVAFLSFNNKQQFAGSITPVTIKVLCLFFPANCSSLNSSNINDPYSEKLANIVFAKLNARFVDEQAHIKLSPEQIGNDYWKGEHPYFGQNVGSWKPWFLKSSNEFRAPTPPTPNDKEWQLQVAQVKASLNNITPEQTKAVVFWAGGPGTITPPGQWITLGNEYMWSHNIPLEKIFLARSVLAMGIADAFMAAFDTKYTYWVKRPNMRDPSIQTIMPTPNHPSYPAAHSTVSATAAGILIYYFPAEKNFWRINMQQAGDSRVWGGIHFPIDSQQGFILGEKVANKIIQAQPQQDASYATAK